MTSPRIPDHLIRDFFTESQPELPDRVFHAVRRDIHRTRQRAVLGPWKEPTMTALARVAIAAALVAAIGLAWVNFGPSLGPGAPPTSEPTSEPTTSPEATRRLIPANAPLDTGRYTFAWPRAAGSDGEAGPSISITVPSDGWTSFDQFAADRNYGPGPAGAGPSFVVWKIANTYTDPCTRDAHASPAPGPGIDELLQALADQPGLTAGALTPVTVDGYSGQYVDLTVATDIATCIGGFYPWLEKFVQGNNEQLRVYALDVDGFRLTFFLRIPERTTPADRTALFAIVDSVDIEP